MEDPFRVLGYEEKIPEGYSFATVAQAQDHRALVEQAYRSSPAFNILAGVRLKNGLFDSGGVKHTCIWRDRLKYKMVTSIKPKSGTELTEEDCLIALAYAAQHDDVDEEVQELVECAGKHILSTRMPFAELGTILHICTNWGTFNTLAKVVTLYPDSIDVYILDKDGDTALHNLPYDDVSKSYEGCKRAAGLLLGLPRVNANQLLSTQNDYQGATALCKALIIEKEAEHVCRALLDAAKENQKNELTSEEAGKHWLRLTAHGGSDEAKYTALHLAVVREYGAVVTKILAYPGAEGLKLTSQQDHHDNTPLHLAARLAHPEICSMLLMEDINKDGGIAPVRAVNNHGETALHIAANCGHAEVCERLLKYSMQDINKNGGINAVTAMDNHGNTALHIAADCGHAEVCERLLEYGASLSVPSKDGRRYALTNAFAKDHKQVVKTLLDACLPAAKSAKSEITTKSKRSLINERFEFGLTPLHVAVAISSPEHIAHLIDAGALIDSRCDDGRTPLHFATQRYNTDTRSAWKMLLRAGEKLDRERRGREKKWINMKDNLGRTALHNVVRLSRQEGSEMEISDSLYNDSRGMDRGRVEDSLGGWVLIPTGEAWLANSNNLREHGLALHTICSYMVEELFRKGALVCLQDCQGETALHEATRSHYNVVHTLLKVTTRSMNDNDRDKWIAMCDFSGETALHEAAKAGRQDVVELLLKETSSRDDLLRVRDMENMTALDYAAIKGYETMMDEMMQKKHGISDITKAFLMWHLKEHISPGDHKHYCEKYEVKENQSSLLQDAVKNEDVDIARELINRGVDVTSLEYDDCRWLALNFGKKASDHPTTEDTLGRKQLVRGVATLLLNPYTHTPVTIGIFGSWGTGKSSFMLQVEEAMLHMAVKETFRKTPSYEKESLVLKLSRNGAALRYMVVKALKQRNMIKGDTYNQSTNEKALLAKIVEASKQNILSRDTENQKPLNIPSPKIESESDGNAPKINIPSPEIEIEMIPQDEADINNSSMDIHNSSMMPLNSSKDIVNIQSKYRRLFEPKVEADIINNFSMELQSKYLQLFKDLALTDRSKLVRSHAAVRHKKNSGINNETLQDAQLIGYTPAVLTLHYNAWQYDNKTEASAGLAVELSHQLESFMTPHQWLRMCWKYSWKSRPRDMCVYVLLPILLALIAIFVILMLWKFVPISRRYKDLSLPIGIVGVMWAFFKTSLQAIQPVTQALLNITKSIDHRSLLGYQHQVIDDIKFLIDQLCHDAHFGWKILGFFFQLFISNKYFMEDTWIWKQHPHSDNFRIVVFIDDLDRCDEKTILELLRAINLILGSCGINVMIGVDKNMVERAITREFLKDTSDKVFDIWVKNTDKKVDRKKEGLEVMENIDKKIPEEKFSQTMEINKNVNDNSYSYTRDLVDNYLQKIIQLPIQMPEPSVKNIEHFLQGQVGQRLLTRPKKHKVKVKVNDEGDAQSQELAKGGGEEKQMNHEGDIQTQGKIENGVGDLVRFHLILATYTPMEKDMLKRLCRSTTKGQRIPRELKRFLNYHRLAWTILSQDPNMKSKAFKGWQIKLILWIFICWNWRDQMDVIFENWHDLRSKTSRLQDIISKTSRLQQQMDLVQGSDKNDGIILKLGDIISTHMENMGWNTKKDVGGKQGGEVVQKSWNDLLSTLKEEYDIPIGFIETFHQFRLYCKLNHLEMDEE